MKTIRLDEILLQKRMVTEEQVSQALARQKAEGGKLGSQLLYHNFIDESNLVSALEEKFDCIGITLLDLYVPDNALKMIPQKIAVARKILPFAYDPDFNLLKIACEDPSDEELRSEIRYLAPGIDLCFYIAAEVALNTIIAKYYLGYQHSPDDRLLLNLPRDAGESGALPIEQIIGASSTLEIEMQKAILLVTDDAESLPHLESLLSLDGFDIITTGSADEAIGLIHGRRFHSVFIKDTVTGDYIDLIDRLRKSSPSTNVRYYENTSELLLTDESGSTAEQFLIKNLELFTSLLTAKEELQFNHGGRVGSYVANLCTFLGLPEKERMTIFNAAYIHDLAKFYYHTDKNQDNRELIKLTVKLLRSINYCPVVVQILNKMYIDLKEKYTKRLPIEALGGNIITIADLYCQTVPVDQRLSLDKLDRIKTKFHDLTGKLFLTEVVDAFIEMIEQELLNSAATEKFSQVLIYSDEPASLYPMELCLKNEGFRPITETSPMRLTSLYKRNLPDILILCLHNSADKIISFVDGLKSKGIDIKSMPTLVLAGADETANLTVLLERGVEDVITIDTNFDMFVAKLKKTQQQILEKSKPVGTFDGNASGAMGRLADMNLIDLLQAMGPSRKTVRISVISAAELTNTLDLYLEKGAIRYARLNDLVGPEAVYEALSWDDGAWTIEPMTIDEIPEPNNDLPNEMILMEGCRLMDEKNRKSEQTSKASNPSGPA